LGEWDEELQENKPEFGGLFVWRTGRNRKTANGSSPEDMPEV
jgi:hypothetical protein